MRNKNAAEEFIGTFAANCIKVEFSYFREYLGLMEELFSERRGELEAKSRPTNRDRYELLLHRQQFRTNCKKNERLKEIISKQEDLVLQENNLICLETKFCVYAADLLGSFFPAFAEINYSCVERQT